MAVMKGRALTTRPTDDDFREEKTNAEAFARGRTKSGKQATLEIYLDRGVQYVHWVMHKCIMVKCSGERNAHKVCKKQVNFYKTGE